MFLLMVVHLHGHHVTIGSIDVVAVTPLVASRSQQQHRPGFPAEARKSQQEGKTENVRSPP